MPLAEEGKIVPFAEPSVFSWRGMKNEVYSLMGYPPTRWVSVKFQDDDYVQVAFPVQLAPDFANAFTEASAFWNTIITGSPAPRVGFNVDTSLNNIQQCSSQTDIVFPAGTEFEGVIVVAEVAPIDEVGGTLGQAGPCAFTSTGGQFFARLGVMTFDDADSQRLLNNGQFDEVIKHEMGHVIGMGTLWQFDGLVDNPCEGDNCNSGNPSYNGQNAISGFNELGGTGPLLVANQGGGGTQNAHWREVTFQNELMTGVLSSGENPMSIFSIKSLQDIGLEVNENAAENFNIPGVTPPAPSPDNGETSSPTYVYQVGKDATQVGNPADNSLFPYVSVVAENSIGLIVGAVVGVLAVIALVAFFVVRRSRKPAGGEDPMQFYKNDSYKRGGAPEYPLVDEEAMTAPPMKQ